MTILIDGKSVPTKINVNVNPDVLDHIVLGDLD